MTRRRRGKAPLVSGWCQNGLHSKCAGLMQTENDHRPELRCGCVDCGHEDQR
jgi:hypothetical protein